LASWAGSAGIGDTLPGAGGLAVMIAGRMRISSPSSSPSGSSSLIGENWHDWSINSMAWHAYWSEVKEEADYWLLKRDFGLLSLLMPTTNQSLVDDPGYHKGG
jgi:hypothetical protein